MAATMAAKPASPCARAGLAASPESETWKHGVGQGAECDDAAAAAAAGEISREGGEQSENRYDGDDDQY
jgi:hypothetical protein